jgi:hypothetical protein
VAAWGDAQAAVRVLGATMSHPEYHQHGDVQEAVRAKSAAAVLSTELGEEAFAAAWAEGQYMGLDGVVAYALALEPPPPKLAASGAQARIQGIP